jgi:ankyrin repeat protein
MAAARNGHAEVIGALLSAGADVEMTDAGGLPPLIYGVASGRMDVVELLMRRGAKLGRDTVLAAAAGAANTEVVERLLADGIDVDAPGFDGVTPLASAGRAGHADMVRLLVKRGAKVDGLSGDGETALIKAAAAGHVAVVQALLDLGADQEILDREGRSARGHAALAEHRDVVDLLIKARKEQ